MSLVNSNEHHRQRRARRLAALAVFALLVIVPFVYPRNSSVATSASAVEPQQQRRRRTPTRRSGRTGAQTSRRPRIDYSRFLHDNNHVKYDKANRANCSTCHRLDSPLQFDIKDYPDHPACVNCHRQQFFIGARPVICTVCHKVSSPRDSRRFDFPRPNTDVTREFPGRFPHALHQDLLATARPLHEKAEAAHGLARRSFTESATTTAADVRAQENCATCHAPYDKTKKEEAGFFPGTGWPDNMLAGVGTFRKIPNGPEGHRTCFVCHASADSGWKSPAPVANDCGGCHSKTAPVGAASSSTQSQPSSAKTTGMLAPLAPLMKVSFTTALLPPRRVITFQHDGGGKPEGGETGSHDIACTICHINITQQQTFIVKPDVPIASCAICHVVGGKKSSLKKGTDTTITSEMEAWVSGRKPCLSCHTAEIGSRPPPCSHYYADKRVPPAELQCR
ncbi:MAG: hypothetical protein ICV68_01020 [Pyrinomonadaceae bacterium]|nr:hypothetical protein [Pyrinomonadaceae bacterium]